MTRYTIHYMDGTTDTITSGNDNDVSVGGEGVRVYRGKRRTFIPWHRISHVDWEDLSE